MFGNRVALLALGVLLVAGCSAAPSTADQLNGMCADVRGKVSPLPSLKELDTADRIVPALNTQLTAAQAGQRRLAAVLTDAADRQQYTDFKIRWNTTVGTLRKLRDTWQNPYADLPYGTGSDTAAALEVAAAEQDAQRDTTAVHRAAVRAGLTGCANIPWHTGS